MRGRGIIAVGNCAAPCGQGAWRCARTVQQFFRIRLSFFDRMAYNGASDKWMFAEVDVMYEIREIDAQHKADILFYCEAD